jgi:pimeloyl-ACP methyl ester carboxylesterase
VVFRAFAGAVVGLALIWARAPPLALIIGYPLHGAAWPEAFVERLATRFSVLTFDNRGTGQSEKPSSGYDLHIMAGDLLGLLHHLSWSKPHVLGFSMGGAIAQEFAIRHPERLDRLVLFATFPGGLYGVRAPWPVLRRLFELDGLFPEDAAKQLWPVTYAADYLNANAEAAEAQMHREIAYPTPSHAACASVKPSEPSAPRSALNKSEPRPWWRLAPRIGLFRQRTRVD